MTKRVVRVREGTPLFDIRAYSGQPQDMKPLGPTQIEQIRLTVRRVPEVVVKVLTRDSNSLSSAAKHINYIGQDGEVALETDDGRVLTGSVGRDILHDWDLDIDELRRQSKLAARAGRKPPRIIHKLVFSMPAGTDGTKVLAAVRNLAREEFWGQHRYVFGLHTDEEHRHVHLALKAISEQGIRLNIKKATLRHWRSEFARNLRTLGIEANATERAVRGQTRTTKKDGIYRASLRGDSNYLRQQAEAVAVELLNGKLRPEPGKEILVNTRKEVVQGGLRLANRLKSEGHIDLARDVSSFLAGMPPPRTDRELVAEELIGGPKRMNTRNLH